MFYFGCFVEGLFFDFVGFVYFCFVEWFDIKV